MKINKKLILLSTISGLLLTTGCSAKEISVSQSQSNWKSKLSTNQSSEDCKGDVCLASIVKPQPTLKERPPQLFLTQTDVVVGDESVTPSEEQHFASNSSITIEYDYSDSPFVEDNAVEIESVPSTYLSNIEVISTDDVTVQVGAFRKFSGAQKYAKRYSLMNSQYSVAIQKDFKDAKPIYRVQVNGFFSFKEAKTFISRYGSQGAFLVRK